MKKYSIISIILFFIGLIFINVALLANVLGLDQHSGWSSARVALLLFGASITFLSILYYLYLDKVHSLAGKIQVFTKSLPVQYFIFPIVLIVIIIYVWFGSSGRWGIWKSHTYYYDNLARGFLNGNLYLPIEPDPKLLELPNPYDPIARAGINSPTDISLYKGRFYMYWGPVPALILSAIHPFYKGKIGDLFLTFIFVSGIFLLQTWLLLTIWNFYFRNLPKWTLYISISLMGLAGPLMLLRHNYESAVIYEAAITSGQFFLIGGAVTAMTAVMKFSISNFRLAAVGFLWALAIGSRQILAAPIGFMILLLTFWLFKTNAWSFNKTTQLLIPLGLPLALGFICLGWYNWARFDSITETGLYYQFAGWNIRTHYNELFSHTYIIQNLRNYLFNPINLTSKFPFVFMPKGSEIPAFPFYSVPDLYNAQPIAGLLYTFPFALFSIVPIFLLVFRRKSDQISVAVVDRRQLNFITLSLSGSALAAFGLLMMFFWAGMRYWGDVLPSLMTLSVIGFWQGYQYLVHKTTTRNLYANAGLFLAIAAILLSTLLALSTNDGLVKLIIRNLPFT